MRPHILSFTNINSRTYSYINTQALADGYSNIDDDTYSHIRAHANPHTDYGTYIYSRIGNHRRPHS